MAGYFLGIDAGTTSVKAGLFNLHGSCLDVTREEYRLSTPSADEVELDPNIYWLSSVRAVRSVIKMAGINPRKVKAIAISSQGETIIPLDASGKPLRTAIVWLDNRAMSQAESLAARFNQQIVHKTTGISQIIPTWSACKILWIQQNEPQIFERVGKYLLVQDYLVYRLTGEYVTNGSISSTTMYYDIYKHQWWHEMLEAIGINCDQLGRISQPGEIVGKLTHEVAEELELSPQTLVVTGGMDLAVGAVGVGSINSTVVSETTGASMVVQATLPDINHDTNNGFLVCVHSIPGKYLYIPNLPTAGMALKWFLNNFGESEVRNAEKFGLDPYDLLTDLAAQISPGSEGLIMQPHLMGAFSPKENPAARGVFSGFTLGHRKGHFVRAILEGVAFNLRQILDAMDEAGMQFSEIRSSGGGSRSALWNQIKADVCGLPIVTLKNKESALSGNAILAGVACGVFDSIAEACDQLIGIDQRIFPGPNRNIYDSKYQRYCELCNCLGLYFLNNH